MIQEFCSTGCGCKLVKGRDCSSQFAAEHYQTIRASAAELTWNELNMVLLGQVMALTSCDSQTLNSSVHRHAPKERERSTTAFHHHGHRVCKTTFRFLHGVGHHRLKAVKANYLSQGLVPRVHGHTGRIAPNALVLEDVRRVIAFVSQYCETNAVLLPGRVPGFKRDDIQLLPSATTKKAVWREYHNTCATLSARTASYPTFCRVWKKFLPHIVISRPMTDLCWRCQQNSTAIIRSVNLSEGEKSEVNRQ